MLIESFRVRFRPQLSPLEMTRGIVSRLADLYKFFHRVVVACRR